VPVRRRTVVGAVGSPVRAVHDRVATLPQKRGSARPASIAPGMTSRIALSVISMTVIDTVSAARASLVASPKAMPAPTSGRMVSALPKKKARPMATARVASVASPRAVPMTSPSTSPIAQPVRQWVVAPNGQAVQGVRCFLLHVGPHTRLHRVDAHAAADALEADLRAQGSPERAAQEKRYLKSALAFHGATLPQIERAVRSFTVAEPITDHDALVSLAEALWSAPVHERRMAAVVLLERHRQLLGPADLALLERLVRESRTWAYVDALAADVVGPICAGAPGTGQVLDRWAADDDFWVRRSALLSQLRPIRDGAPLERFLRYADALLDEREFFIRKAIGWVLREAGRRRADEVATWLAARTDRAAGLTVREAVKYLPAAEARRLVAAQRARRVLA